MVRSVEKSLPWIASTVRAPSPGMPKKDSSSNTPVNRNGICTTTLVRIGMSALRSTCRTMTRASPQPLAQAAGDRAVIGVAAAEIEGEHAAIVLEQQRVGVALGVGGLHVDEEGLVVAVVLLPLRVDLRARALAHRLAGDVVGVRHGKE